MPGTPPLVEAGDQEVTVSRSSSSTEERGRDSDAGRPVTQGMGQAVESTPSGISDIWGTRLLVYMIMYEGMHVWMCKSTGFQPCLFKYPVCYSIHS
jgi:hypothetical protein